MPCDLDLLGERLREARKRLKLSQMELAEQMGVSHGWISEIENGKQKRLEVETVHRFCQALAVSADYLLGLADTPDRAPRPRRRLAAEYARRTRDAPVPRTTD